MDVWITKVIIRIKNLKLYIHKKKIKNIQNLNIQIYLNILRIVKYNVLHKLTEIQIYHKLDEII